MKPYLACKQVVSKYGSKGPVEDFKNELRVLSMLRCLRHPCIIELITAFIKEDTYHLLLPFAEGDLNDILTPSSPKPGFETGAEWCNALWGLSSALEAVHPYFAAAFNVSKIGRHCDIRPANILYSKGRLMLSDFGLSRLREEEDGSRSHFKYGEGDFIAPECERLTDGLVPSSVGRAGDIWSFGYILTEVLAYASGSPISGSERIKKFRLERKFKDEREGIKMGRFYTREGINPVVAAFLDANSSNVWQKSLSLLISEILTIAPEDRPKAERVTSSLVRTTLMNTYGNFRELAESTRSSDELDLQIEFQRIEVWAQTVRLTPETGLGEWLSSNHKFEELRRVVELWERTVQEAAFVREQCSGERRLAYNICYNLKKLTDDLWDMHSVSTRRAMSHHLEEAILKYPDLLATDVQINTDADETYVEAAHNQPRRLLLLAAMRQISSMTSGERLPEKAPLLDILSLDRPFKPFAWHFLSGFAKSNEKVLIEITQYHGEWVSRVPELIQRIRDIASLRTVLPNQTMFPILRCLGYYHDGPRHSFGLVYQLPPWTRNSDPLSLKDIIDKTSSRKKQPSLTQKFKLATVLTSHVLDFHKSGWLHKSICSFNVIFFPGVFSSPAESLVSPVFIGFNHSRVNQDAAFSNGPDEEKQLNDYQHPAYLRFPERTRVIQRYREEFDYYSVGLMLLEIALWDTVANIFKKIPGSPEEIRQKLLESYIKIAGTYMGDAYAESIRVCLSMYTGEERSGEDVRNEFSEAVVLPISNRVL